MDRKIKMKKKVDLFRILMMTYIVVFIVALFIFMLRFWVYLDEYEQSQPIRTIEAYMPTIPKDYYSSLCETAISEFKRTPYESADTLRHVFSESVSATPKYTFRRNPVKYTDEHPAYYILADGKIVAETVLEKNGTTPDFELPLWTVSTPQSALKTAVQPQYTLDISAPCNALITINDVPLDIESMTEETVSVSLSENALELIEAPTTRHFLIDGLYDWPSVSAVYPNGEKIPSKLPIPDETVGVQEYDFTGSESSMLAEEQTQYVEKLTKAYINYVINKNKDIDNNLAMLDNYLLKNSNVYKQMHAMKEDVKWNQTYTARQDKVLTCEHFMPYSDDCYSVETHFEVELTKNAVTNNYNGTIRWTLIRTEFGWKANEMTLL